jgi:hypothetical protein
LRIHNVVWYGSLYGRTEQRALLPWCNKSLFFHDGSDHPHGRRCESRGGRACVHDKPHFSQPPAIPGHALASSTSSPTYPSNHPARVISSPRPSHIRRRDLRPASSVANLQHPRHQCVKEKAISRQPTRSTTTKGRGQSGRSQCAPETFVQFPPPSLAPLRLSSARQTRRVRRAGKQSLDEGVGHTRDERVLRSDILRALRLRLLRLLRLWRLLLLRPRRLSSPRPSRRRASRRCSSQPRSPSRPSRRPSRSRVARRCPTRKRTTRARIGRKAVASASRRMRCSRCCCRGPPPISHSRFARSVPLLCRCVGDGGDGDGDGYDALWMG